MTLIRISVQRPVLDADNNDTGQAKPVTFDIGYKFNNYAVESLPKIKGDITSNTANVARLVWAGYIGKCYYEDVAPQITWQELLDWIDDTDLETPEYQEYFSKMSKDFLESNAYKKVVKRRAQAAANEEKKSPLN